MQDPRNDQPQGKSPSPVLSCHLMCPRAGSCYHAAEVAFAVPLPHIFFILTRFSLPCYARCCTICLVTRIKCLRWTGLRTADALSVQAKIISSNYGSASIGLIERVFRLCFVPFFTAAVIWPVCERLQSVNIFNPALAPKTTSATTSQPSADRPARSNNQHPRANSFPIIQHPALSAGLETLALRL